MLHSVDKQATLITLSFERAESSWYVIGSVNTPARSKHSEHPKFTVQLPFKGVIKVINCEQVTKDKTELVRSKVLQHA